MTIFALIEGYFAMHPYIVSLIGAMLSEEIVIFLAVLAGKGVFHVWVVYVFGFIGFIIIDSAWFIFARSAIGKKLENTKFFSRKYSKSKNKFSLLNKKGQFLSICLSKFIYGTRIISMTYHSLHKMPYKRFLIYDIIGTIIWESIMVSIGFLAGRGFKNLLKITRGIEKWIAILFIAILIFYLAHRIISYYLLKNSKKAS